MEPQPYWPESCPYYRPTTIEKERLRDTLDRTVYAEGELRFLGVSIAQGSEELEQEKWDSRIL